MNTHNYDYVFRDHPQVKQELEALGIKLELIQCDDEFWPSLFLPSGHALMIMRDDEGNGPGAIDIIDPD